MTDGKTKDSLLAKDDMTDDDGSDTHDKHLLCIIESDITEYFENYIDTSTTQYRLPTKIK